MSDAKMPGARFRTAVEEENPLQVVGAVSAYCAHLAEAAGFKALYLSGGGVAASSCGIPDLGFTTLEDVLTDARRLCNITDLPLLVDIDTGWDDVARTIRSMAQAGVAAVHIEDQVAQKRCGHRPGKVIVSCEEMTDRIKAASNARPDDSFVIMARTDALASEGFEAAVDRAGAYLEAGADMIFPEAVADLETYRKFAEAVDAPILANITEFGVTPLFTIDQLADVGVALALYPLSAFRAMSAAALRVYKTIRDKGTQQSLIDIMQTRDDLYQHLNYHDCEQELDKLLAKVKKT